MKKLILTIVAMAIGCIAAFSANEGYSLVVTLNSGDEVEYRFADTPVATFENDDLVVTTKGGLSKVQHPLATFAKMTIKAAPADAIEAVDAVRASFLVGEAWLQAQNLEAGTRVSVYSDAGTLMAAGEADAAGRVSVSVAACGKGVYVVKAGNHTFKFVK